LLSEQGAEVAAVDRDITRLRETVEKMTVDSLRVEAFSADVTNEADVESVVDMVENAWGRWTSW
jgi:NADP-dependent 3-hydroxy acid dehydrogenase YdfG